MDDSTHNYFAINRKIILTIACAMLVGVGAGIGLSRIYAPQPGVFVSTSAPTPAIKNQPDLEAHNHSLGRENAQLKERLAKAEEMAAILRTANGKLEANIADLQKNLNGSQLPATPLEELAPGYDMCMEKSNGVTVNMLDCINDANEYIDAKLNDAYNKLLKACDYPGNEVRSCTRKIKNMEQNWIRFRDAATDIMALVDFKGLGDGTMYRVISFEFYVNESKKHLQKLNDMLEHISQS